VADSWAHRVAAVATTDADLAEQLEEAATAQAADGQHGTAARYLDWAADLSPDRQDNERRRQLSCVHTLLSRGRTRALELRETITRCADSPLRSLALGLTALLAAGDRATADRWLSDAVRATDPWTRSTSAAGLAGVRTWQGHTDEAIEVARLALAIPELPLRLADYTRVLLAVARARRDGMHRGLDELAHLPRDPMLVGPADLDALSCRGALRTMIGSFAEAKRDLRTVIARQRAGDFTMSGTNPLSYLSAIHYVEGKWDDATIVIGQALSMVDTEEQPQNQALRRMCAALVPAGRGQWAVAMRHARRAARVADQLGGPQDLRYAAIAAATVGQAQADPASMLAALSPMAQSPMALSEPAGTHSWWALWWRPLLVEALIGVGSHARAAEQLRILSGLSEGVTYLTSTMVRLETALSPPSRAITVVEEYLTDRTAVFPLADGMLEHDHGRRLLAAGRRDAAVTWLTSAKTRFTSLAATPFAQRVDADLASCGVRTGPRPRDPLPGLTEREAQVAHLASRRLTNRQIAGQLYVTTKTVEYHLGNIYAKLGITSRTQLRDLLSPDPPNGR
jgi:DNA-binding CsgD family transcriptional regulator